MQIRLQSFQKLLLKLVCLALVVCYIEVAVSDYVAYGLSTSSRQPQALERAVALDPGDASYHDRLGQDFIFTEQRPGLAIAQYKSAVALNPHIADYWLDLATAYEVTGAREQQELALEQAHRVDPTTPDVSWRIANALLVRGDRQKAFAVFHTVLQSDPELVPSAVRVCWFSTHDVTAMLDVLPAQPNVYLNFLNLLIGEKQPGAAVEVWSRLVGARQPFDPSKAAPYVEYLFSQHYTGRAQAAWNDLAAVDHGFRPYLPSAANLVVNGGFENKLLNMGFDWRYEGRSQITLALDGEQFHGGSRSLSISFEGGAVTDTGISQLVAVDPSVRYSFSAYVKTDNVFAAQGPQFAVSDAYSQSSPLLLTEELLGTSGWKQVSGTFETGPSTNLVLLKIVRAANASPITGRMWVDDVVVARN